MRSRLVQRRPIWQAMYSLVTWEDKAKIAQMVGYTPHVGQLPVHMSQACFKILCCGRRFGKSKCAGFEATVCAVLGGWVMVVAPTYDLAGIVFREVEQFIFGSDLACLVTSHKMSQGKGLITLSTGGRIFVRSSSNAASLLGEGLDLVIFDEAAEEPDPEVWTDHLRPALLDHAGSALFISTPEGDDWFKEIFDKGQERIREYESWQMPSKTNPHVPASRLALDMADLPESTIRQEYFAEFLDSVGSVFRGYRKLATSLMDDPRSSGHSFAIGVDIAQYEDWTVIIVIDATDGRVVYADRFNQIDYTLQVPRILDVSMRYQAPIMIDATSNEAVWQMLRDQAWWTSVHPFKFTNLSKNQVVNQLAMAIEHQEIELLAPLTDPPEPGDIARTILSELGSYRYERTAAGTLRMNAPPGKHDDCVIALCLAYEMARRAVGGAPVVFQGGTAQAPTIAGTFGRPSPKLSKRRR